MAKRSLPETRVQRQLRRDYEARQAVHSARTRRTLRDNWLAGIAAVLVCGGAILTQYAYFNWGPGTPVPAPTDTATPTPTDTATDAGYGTAERDDSLTAPTADSSGDTPVVTLPGADVPAPTSLSVQVLAEGDGATVAEGQTVTFDYVGVNWTNGVVFDSSYAKGSPYTAALSDLIDGFSQSMIGQKTGSTLLASIPADLAYPDSTDANTAGALVFYIHIESAQ